jgi:hypothetical protein
MPRTDDVNYIQIIITIIKLREKVRGKVVPVHFLTEHQAVKAYWGVEV